MSEINLGTHNYIGIGPCGCIRAVVADMPGYQQDTARDVAGFISSGLTVERVTHEEFRGRNWLNPECTMHATARDLFGNKVDGSR